MKKSFIPAIIFLLVIALFSCRKEDSVSEKLLLLTNHIWVADSLLADGVDASGPGGLLEMFKGDTKFNSDGTGYVGTIVGTWQFSNNETQIVIKSASLPAAVATNIVELTDESLKITTTYPMPGPPPVFLPVRMTFKPK